MISFQFNQTEDLDDEPKFISEIETTKLFDVKSPTDSSKAVKSVYSVGGPAVEKPKLKVGKSVSIHKSIYRVVPNTHGHMNTPIPAKPTKPTKPDVPMNVEISDEDVEKESPTTTKNLEERLRTMEFKYLGALRQINKLGSEVKVLQKQVQILLNGRETETPYETFYYNKD